MRWICLVVIAGCGGGGGDLTCELLADPHNCFAETGAAAQACSPTTVGVLAADRTTCTFADGTLVTFDVPLALQATGLDHLQFTVTGPGGCTWAFHDFFGNHIELTASGHTDVVTLDGGTFDLACGAGGDYSAAVDDVFKCTPIPTGGWNLDSTSFDFSINAAGVRSPLFSCVAPM